MYKVFLIFFLMPSFMGVQQYINLELEPVKRDKTLLERGLDFARALEIFEGTHFTGQDKRMDYEEDRFITVG